MREEHHPATGADTADEILRLERVVLRHARARVDEHSLRLRSRHEEDTIDEPGVAIGDKVIVGCRMFAEEDRVGAGPLRSRHDALDLAPAVVREGGMDMEIAAVFPQRARSLDRRPRRRQGLDGRMNRRHPLRGEPVDGVLGPDRPGQAPRRHHQPRHAHRADPTALQPRDSLAMVHAYSPSAVAIAAS